jgi:CspA family cold shock protein
VPVGLYQMKIKINLLKINELLRLLSVSCAKLINKIMSKGTVKFFNESKGFGFIKEENSQKDYFVHSTGLKDTITENDVVTFDLEMGKKGLNAVNVKLA